ncbi:MAG: phosphatase PAP2 family protein [archaeon]
MVFEEIIVNQFLQSFSTPLLDLFFKTITLFGHPALWFFIATIFFWSGREKKSFTIATLILLTGFFSGILKVIIARPRPEGLIVMENGISYSFPSGHSTIAAGFTAYAWFAKTISKNLKYFLIILTTLTAISRIYLGVHFISDVIAGLLIGTIIGWFVYKLEGKLNKMNFHISKIKEEFLVILFFVLVIIFGLFIPSEFYGAYTLFGYFTGYAILRHTSQQIQKNATKKQEPLSFLTGLIILSILGAIAYSSTGALSQVLFFITGIFVTLLWPIIAPKLGERKKSVKSRKK